MMVCDQAVQLSALVEWVNASFSSLKLFIIYFPCLGLHISCVHCQKENLMGYYILFKLITNSTLLFSKKLDSKKIPYRKLVLMGKQVK